MGSSGAPPASTQRARTKASDFSELFRSTHGSRHSSRTGAGNGSTPSLVPSSKEKPAGTKAPSRRSMLPFLGRKKHAEQGVGSATAMSRKSVGNAVHPITPVNTVRRSFGNGHAVLMITPSSNVPSVEPPLPSKFPLVDTHPPSFGSKIAAHFTPLRSPSRNSKVLDSMVQKPPPPFPPVPSPIALSPPVPEVRAPSLESQHSNGRSRSTTPRPLREPHSSAVENGDEEDFSDLFTLPDKFKKPQQYPKCPPASVAHLNLGDSPNSPKKSGELTPTTPLTPLGPPLQFPIPPSMITPSRLIMTEKGFPHYSSELASLSSHGSKSPAKRPSPIAADSGSTRSLYSNFSFQDERKNSHHRTTSISGSDTDTSRAKDATYSASSRKLRPAIPKPSSMKPKVSGSNTAKASCGPPPSVPLPSPPLPPDSGGLGPRSAPIASPNRVVFPRPRANTLSVTSNLVIPDHTLPRSNHSSPPRSTRVDSNARPDATTDELREALFQQRRKNTQLQEYIVTVTKRYEDDRMTMTRTIEKLERTVRKKMREIEGLRWLVIHNGAVSDIDAAANLARSSLSTQDGGRGPSPPPTSPALAPHDEPPFSQSGSGQAGTSMGMSEPMATPGFYSGSASSAASFSTSSVSETTSLTPPCLSLIPERIDGISRAERQKLKEERRASKALRRISAVSPLTSGADSLPQSSCVDSPLDPNFDPRQNMDKVLEKLQPFRHT